MHVGFIGLGRLGRAIAGRLMDCGHTLAVWNRTASKAEGMGAEIAVSPRSVAEKTDLIFVCLFDSHAVRAVLAGEDGVLVGGATGKIIVDLSTNHFREVSDFYALSGKAGCVYLEAPVLGSVVPASQGALTVLVSGSRTGYEEVTPILEDIGKNLFYLGEPGLATKMKLINNLALGCFMATIAEALSLGEEIGMEKKDILEILSAGAGGSLVLNAKKGKLLDQDFSPHFSGSLMYKDLQCLQDLAYERKKALFTGAVTKELYARTYEEGIEQEDFSAIYKVFRKG